MTLKKSLLIIFIGLLLIVTGVFLADNYLKFNPEIQVNSFEECVAAGNPVMESYPRQCRHGEKTFIEEFDTPGDLIEKSCENTSDCMLPFAYAALSNCPYQTACIQSSCAVICPLWEHSPNPEESISYQVSCSEDADCDCSDWDSTNQYPCKCLDGQCASVVVSK